MPTPTVKLNLGSSSYITTTGGYATEHLQYTCAEPAERMAYGEDFIHQHASATLSIQFCCSNFYTPYTFSAKEKDAETGFSYFGARYYADNLSIWLSVDPLADKYPHQSPFMYCSGNPIMRVDPTGMSDEDFPPPNFEGLHWKDADGSFDRNAPNETYKWTKPDGSPGGAHSSDFNISSTKIDKAAQSGGGDGKGIDKSLEWAGKTNDFIDAAGKVSIVGTGKAIGRYTIPAGYVIGAVQIGRGYYKDGNRFGYNAQKATAGFAGGLAGAWAGFEAGAVVGFEGGFVIGAAFGGIGAIPGAVVGGVLGGFGGAFGGAYYGGQFGASLITK